LERTTTGNGSVCSLQSDEYRDRLRLKTPDGQVAGEPLPSLSSLLEAMVGDAQLLVEIKPPNAAGLMHRAIDAIGTRGAVQSFDLANVEHALRHPDPCPVLWLIDKASQLDEVPRVACDGIGADFNLLNAETVAFLRRMKKRIAAWTVNQYDDIVRMLALGVDVLITDDPELAHLIAQGRHPA
jgi:glycerophosphoryl diester phosphodiesterase